MEGGGGSNFYNDIHKIFCFVTGLKFLSNVAPGQGQLQAFFIVFEQISKKWFCVHLLIFFCCQTTFLFQINTKTAKPIGPNFLWDLKWPRDGLWTGRIKIFASKQFLFSKKIKSYVISSKMFEICLLLNHEHWATLTKLNQNWAKSIEVNKLGGVLKLKFSWSLFTPGILFYNLIP